MTHSPLAWIGLAGIEPDDNERAQHWHHRLHGVMVAIALLAVPAYFLESARGSAVMHWIAHVLDVVIFFAFLYCMTSLIVDILYAYLDPRIRYEK